MISGTPKEFAQFSLETKPVFSKSNSEASEMATVKLEVCCRLVGASVTPVGLVPVCPFAPEGMMRAGMARAGWKSLIDWHEEWHSPW